MLQMHFGALASSDFIMHNLHVSSKSTRRIDWLMQFVITNITLPSFITRARMKGLQRGQSETCSLIPRNRIRQLFAITSLMMPVQFLQCSTDPGRPPHSSLPLKYPRLSPAGANRSLIKVERYKQVEETFFILQVVGCWSVVGLGRR